MFAKVVEKASYDWGEALPLAVYQAERMGELDPAYGQDTQTAVGNRLLRSDPETIRGPQACGGHVQQPRGAAGFGHHVEGQDVQSLEPGVDEIAILHAFRGGDEGESPEVVRRDREREMRGEARTRQQDQLILIDRLGD